MGVADIRVAGVKPAATVICNGLFNDVIMTDDGDVGDHSIICIIIINGSI